jgi:hypothetical protein
MVTESVQEGGAMNVFVMAGVTVGYTEGIAMGFGALEIGDISRGVVDTIAGSIVSADSEEQVIQRQMRVEVLEQCAAHVEIL